MALTDGNITFMFSDTIHSKVFVATQSGLSIFWSNYISLESKANEIESLNYPRHDRYGLVGDCSLKHYGNLTSWQAIPDDNNGLWTSMYLTGLSFKYSIYNTNKTLENLCWHHLQALNRLHNMTGINGLVARSYAKISDGKFDGLWYNSTTMPGWQWKGDTSSDEICGHIMIYAIFYDLVANTQDEKEFVLDLMTSTIDYIIENDYKLIDADGHETTWGFWDPYSLNNVGENFDERGLNSMQIMTWIMTCYYYTSMHIDTFYTNNGIDGIGGIDASSLKLKLKKSKLKKFKESTNIYLEHWETLGNKYGYWNNILNQKITIPDDINHSDDELAGTTYILYFWVKMQAEKYINNQTYFNTSINKQWNEYFANKYIYFDLSWNRTYSFIKTKWQSLYVLIDLMANPNKLNDDDIKNSILKEFERWPMEWIDWPTINDDRIDIIPDWTVGRSCLTGNMDINDYNDYSCARESFAPDQRDGQRWNSDPFTFNGGSGGSEIDTGSFTLAYWLARYLGIE